MPKSSKSALELINVNKSNLYVKIQKSKIPSIEKDKYNKGLFATRFIPKGTNIVIYFGDVLDKEELMEKYQKDKNIMKFIRNGHDFIVDGSVGYKTNNLNLSGVYVNDRSKLKSTSMKDMKKYYKTRTKCNVDVLRTSDFPVYIAKKNIQEGEELLVHYGIGYWLYELGVKPADIHKKYRKIIKKFY